MRDGKYDDKKRRDSESYENKLDSYYKSKDRSKDKEEKGRRYDDRDYKKDDDHDKGRRYDG